MIHADLHVRGGTCVFPWGTETADVFVRDGRIAQIGGTGSAAAEFDAKNLHILPGLIDAHVHFRDPGDSAIETIGSGTRGAVLGGICTVFDMPNTSPAITNAAALTTKSLHVEQTAWCDVGLYVGATKSNVAELAHLERLPGVCAVKVFAGSSTGDLLVEDDASLERVMRAGTRRVAYHSEDEFRLRDRRAQFSGGGYAMHAQWRDAECAFLGTRRILALARKTGRTAHILHVSTAEELAYLPAFRDVATCEMLVNHLTQVAPECYERLGGYAVMNPPLRDARHHEAAWEAVRDGRVDVIGSDHAPHSRAAKERPWPDCAAGLTGVQTIVPVMLDHVAAGRLSLSRLADLMAAGPSRVYGLQTKGRLAVGFDADLTIVDISAQRTITSAAMATLVGWTPFDGKPVTGWPVATILRGQTVMRDGDVIGAPRGRLTQFA